MDYYKLKRVRLTNSRTSYSIDRDRAFEDVESGILIGSRSMPPSIHLIFHALVAEVEKM